MRNKLTHQQRFQQKMSLTPQMRQSINMLGMSVTDLAEYVDFAATQNPFLKKLLDTKASENYRNRAAASGGATSYDDKDRIRDEENPRLRILSQLKMAGIAETSYEIAEYLVFEMDDNGYIAIDPEEVARDLGVSVDDVVDCIKVIQKMEPAGIGAKDVTECLQLQLRRKGAEDSLEYRIVSSHLAEVAREEIEKISKALKADPADVKKAIAAIKKLNPRPASNILGKESEKVVPELTARFEKKKVRLEINRGAVPGLKLYNPYENDFNIVKDPEARKFMKENINAAKNLIDNLKRREDTICKVANYILEFQRDSLTRENGAIKPLTIKDIAKAVNFHPSTVSRAVSRKYIKVNDSVVSLRSLLSHGMKNESGDIQSKAAIRVRIGSLVKSEDPAKPLTDEAISRELKKEGVTLSRRTVVKYRQILHILPVYLRKKARGA